jgi:hypothetical protein
MHNGVNCMTVFGAIESIHVACSVFSNMERIALNPEESAAFATQTCEVMESRIDQVDNYIPSDTSSLICCMR